MRSALAILFCLGVVHSSSAQSGDNVAVVINDNSAQSRTVGEYYAAKRQVPAANIFRIRTSLDEVIDRATFTESIEWPLQTLISARGLQDRLLYVVLTKDVPVRIAGSSDRFWTAASVDSELTLLYRRMVGTYVPVIGHVDNPYFLNTGKVDSVNPFTHRDHDIFLVSRLDGTSVEDVLALIDRAAAPAREKVRQSLTGTEPSIVPATGDMATPFPPGSIAAAALPYRASSFHGAALKTGSAVLTGRRRKDAFEIADLVHQGATAVAGESRPDVPVNPIRTDILFPAYLAGANAVEAFYLAIPYLSANTVIIGDPLCAPFRHHALTQSDIEAGEDPDSLLPSLFAERRVTAVRTALPFVPRTAVALALRAAKYVERGERELARPALEQATAIAPQFASAQFNLASLLVTEGEYELAVERYNSTLEAQPAAAREEAIAVFGQPNPIGVRAAALNNLAYLLAVHLHKPAEALPFALRAVAQSPNVPALVDTLAWVEFLLGDTTNATTHVRAALAGRPPSATIHLHAAAILAAGGARAEAEAFLQAALRLQPDLQGSAETAEILTRLDGEGAAISPK